MKASKQCPKCDSLKVGILEQLWERYDSANAWPQTIGHITHQGRLYSRAEYVGVVEAFVCAACGYFETYVKEPQAIAFNDLEGFTWLNSELAEEGPYR